MQKLISKTASNTVKHGYTKSVIDVVGANTQFGPGGFSIVATGDERGHAFYGLALVISAHPTEPVQRVQVHPGEVVEVDGFFYRVGLLPVTDVSRGYPTLEPVRQLEWPAV